MTTRPGISPLGLALMSLGVLAPVVPYPRREVYPRDPQPYPKPLTLDELADVGAQMRAIGGKPAKREKYELRPLAERKERRRKRKQRRNR